MASALYILDLKGGPLIYRSYRGDAPSNAPAVFQKRVLDEEEFRVTPVFEEKGYTYTYIRVNDVFIVMISSINTCTLLQLAFMKRCITVFETYFRTVNEDTVRDNFVIIYELLDEMCDFGFPQYTEEKVLKEYITQEGLISSFLSDNSALKVKQLPAAVTGVGGATPWRAPNKYRYKKNEVFLDVIESANVLISQDGEALSGEIIGALKMKVHLSGMPTLRVGLNDKIMLELAGKTDESIEMEDVKLHQCVKLNLYESERIITFIPPDGDFDLMTYRLNKRVIPFAVSTVVVRHGSSRVEMRISAESKYRSTTSASFVDFLIPIPSDADSPEAHCSLGSVKYSPESSVLLWSLKNVSGNKKFSCNLQFHLPSVRSPESQAVERAPIQVKFEIPYFAASGFRVRYVKITEISNYEAVPWVRYLTKSGNYQIRTR